MPFVPLTEIPMSIPIPFDTLWVNYPHPDREPRDVLYRSLGWDDLIGQDSYRNTCAIRMSICLLRSGAALPSGELKVRKGPLKGKPVKIRFDDLAEYLAQVWGPPEVIAHPSRSDLESRGDGVIAFFGLPSSYPGHIDLLDVSRTAFDFLFFRWSQTTSECGTHCYFQSREAWYWAA